MTNSYTRAPATHMVTENPNMTISHSEEQSKEDFDFKAHRRTAIDQYHDLQPLYESFAEVIKKILLEAIRNAHIKVASVEARAKTLGSFGDKAATPEESDPNKPRYPKPLVDITDLAASRVITFFLQDVQKVDGLVEKEFNVLERTDKSALLLREARVGYQSVHYIIELRPSRTTLSEYARYEGLRAEIQVRTVLQHAWAEIEHDIQYKSVETIPPEIRRRFTSLAGLLEIADREFQSVQAEDERLRQEARRSVKQGKLENVDITGDALRTYLDQRLGGDGRMTKSSYEWTAKHLHRLGFSNLRQIDEAIAPYDHESVSRKVYGNLQGQLTRFEDMLLAAMGQPYIDRHQLADQAWWRDWRQKHLDLIRSKGIVIGSYTPELTNK